MLINLHVTDTRPQLVLVLLPAICPSVIIMVNSLLTIRYNYIYLWCMIPIIAAHHVIIVFLLVKECNYPTTIIAAIKIGRDEARHKNATIIECIETR